MDPVPHPTPPSYYNDLAPINGPMSLAQFIQEIEDILAEEGHHVQMLSVCCRPGGLHMFIRGRNPPIANPNLLLDDAIEVVAAKNREDARLKSIARKAAGRRKLRPKKIDRGADGSFDYQVEYGTALNAYMITHCGSWRPV